MVGMDFVGPVDGRYLLVIFDFLSRRVQMDMHRTADGSKVISSLQRWVQECGPIKILVTD